MKKIFLFLLLILSTNAYAGTWTPHTVYGTNSQVTSTNLNGNINSLGNILNGQLDNTNANTAGGYRFYEIVGALPAAGTQGRCAFLTTDNTLNFDTGSAWQSALTVTGAGVQGDVIYHDGTGWKRLGAGTSGYVLKTQGAAANPAWQMLGFTNIAWVKFDGDTAPYDAYDSYNCTSITRNSQGNYTVNWSITFGNAHYLVIANGSALGTSADVVVNSQTATTTTIICYDSAGSNQDADPVYVLALGD